MLTWANIMVVDRERIRQIQVDLAVEANSPS